MHTRASAEKFIGVGGNEKIPKSSKKDRKIALLSFFQGDERKKDRKIAKKDQK